MVSSLLESAPFSLLKTGYEVDLNWLGEFARAIIEGIGIIGIGIIVFALVLKAIILPADIYQRVKMRKQALIMRDLKPELEKLQKQYANDSKMYNQKMSELYKKSGYSILGACLPMILSLVILIVAFQGFRTYSQYANLMMYHDMSEQYNSAILNYCADGGYDVLLEDDDGEYTERTEYSFGSVFDGETLAWKDNDAGAVLEENKYTMYLEPVQVPKRIPKTENGEPVKDENGEIVYETDEKGNPVYEKDEYNQIVYETVYIKYMQVEAVNEEKFLYYVYSLESSDYSFDCRNYRINTQRLEALASAPEEKADADKTLGEKAALSQEERDTLAQIRKDRDDAIATIRIKNADETNELIAQARKDRDDAIAEILNKNEGEIDKLIAEAEENCEDRIANILIEKENELDKLIAEAEENCENRVNSLCINHVVAIGAQRAADWYRGEGDFEGEGHDAGFLWVKNIWYPDVSYNHPIQDYSGFISQLDTDVTFGRGDKVEERALSAVFSETQYNNLTSRLEAEKDSPNGYFILIILSIGFMVLSQFISMRSQKETTKYQTVDGKSAMSQKMMMIIMPLIYAVFAFIYSAAFSIYMTMSSIISLLVTLLSNFIIGRVFKKKEEKEIKEQYTRTLPWQQNAKNGKNKENKKDKKKK